MRMHPVSMAITQIEAFSHDESLGRATGFLFNGGQELALVSNWHVFAGRHPDTNIALNALGFTPNRLTFHLTVMLPPDEEKRVAADFRSMDLPLYDPSGRPHWLQHEGYVGEDGQHRQIDIGVLPLAGLVPDIERFKDMVPSFEQQVLVSGETEADMGWEHGYVRVGSDVFIPGFPLGLASQGVAPVWKRGSVASEPLFDIEGGLRIVLVDALTRHGMSGSPVVYLGDTVTNWQGKPTILERGTPWLVGVYAGRRGSSEDELSMALGRAWKIECLHEIFMNRVPGGTWPPDTRAD